MSETPLREGIRVDMRLRLGPLNAERSASLARRFQAHMTRRYLDALAV